MTVCGNVVFLSAQTLMTAEHLSSKMAALKVLSLSVFHSIFSVNLKARVLSIMPF